MNPTWRTASLATPAQTAGGPLLIVLLALFSVELVRTAWISDDAYITFRTIDNFVHGYGLRWNVAERVQAYTHPLWLFVVTLAYWITRDAYFTPLAISIGLTLLTIWQVTRIPSSRASVVLGLTALLVSRAFIDYSTGGLENPLTNLLLVIFFRLYLETQRRPGLMALVAALLMLSRADVGLLVLPALLAVVVPASRGRELGAVAAGFLPLVAWELFSLVYYGFPFPNTAYAKLKTGVPERDLLQQGVKYLIDSAHRDPVTLLVLVAATALAFLSRLSRVRPIAIGIVCYVFYVVYVGGDFMSGRMLAAPLVCAVLVLVAEDVAAMIRWQWALVALIAFVGLSPHLGMFSQRTGEQDIADDGVADERLFYYSGLGLMNYRRGEEWPNFFTAESGRRTRRDGTRVIVYCCNGMLGYFAGPGVYIVDIMGLGDPLLARLPALTPWRIGHFQRDIPAGYMESVESGQNRVKDSKLATYYEQLRLITRGRLWNRRRLRAIVKMNAGAYEYLLRD